MDNLNKIKLLTLILFSLSVIIFFSENAFSQSDLDNLQIIDGEGYYYGFKNENPEFKFYFGNAIEANYFLDSENTSWEFDYYDQNPIKILTELDEFSIGNKSDKTIIYRDLEIEHNYANVTWFNMNNYILDVGSKTGFVNIIIKDVNSICVDDSFDVKNINDGNEDRLNYILLNLFNCFDGELNISIDNDKNVSINKSSFFNTSLPIKIRYYKVNQTGDYYHSVMFKNEELENYFFYNKNDKYYEISKSDARSQIFGKKIELSKNDTILFNTQKELEDSVLYRYVNLKDIVTSLYGRQGNNIDTKLDYGEPVIITGFSKSNWSMCSLGSSEITSNSINCNDDYIDIDSIKVLNYTQEYDLLFLKQNLTTDFNKTLEYKIENNSVLNLQLKDNKPLINYIYHPRLMIELPPGNYTLMINDTFKYPARPGYNLYNTSLFIANTYNQSRKENTTKEDPVVHYYIFELTQTSNVSLLDTLRDTKYKHDVILSKYTKWNDFDKNIPVDIGFSISKEDFSFSVCNSTLRNESTDCDYYMDKSKYNDKQFSFNDPYVFIDYNITDIFISTKFDFDKADYDFKFTLSDKGDLSSSKLILYNDSTKWYDVELSSSASADLDFKMDWELYSDESDNKNCNIGFNISAGSAEYTEYAANKVSYKLNQNESFAKSDLDFYHNYLIFRKCYNGNWIPLYPRYDFTELKDNIVYANEESQCGLDGGSKDYYLKESGIFESYVYTAQAKLAENLSFESYHQCYDKKWISSHFQNFRTLIDVANTSNWDHFSIYCDWTVNLDLMNIGLELDKFHYEKYPQGCVLVNLDNQDRIISFSTSEKDMEIQYVKDYISLKSLDFDNGPSNEDMIQEDYEINFSSYKKDFLLIYNKTEFEVDDFDFSLSNDENMFERIIGLFNRLLKFFTGIDSVNYAIEPKDYYSIFYTQNDDKVIHSFAYLKNRNTYGIPENYTMELEFNGFDSNEIRLINRSVFGYHEDIGDNLSILDVNVSLNSNGIGNVTFYEDSINLENYRKFYNELIPNLRVD